MYKQSRVNLFGLTVLCGISVGVGATATNIRSDTEAVISSNVSNFGFAHDAATAGLEVTFSSDDIAKLAASRPDGFGSEDDIYYIPIAHTQMCVKSNLSTADTAAEQLRATGAVTAMTMTGDKNKKLKTAVVIRGNRNGARTGLSEYVFFCSGTSGTSCGDAINIKFATTSLVPDTSGTGIVTPTSGIYFSDKIWSTGTLYEDVTKATSESCVSNFNHYSTQTSYSDYSRSITSGGLTDLTHTNTSFALNKAVFDNGTCGGTNNDDAVEVYVFVNVKDVLSNPAGTYEGAVKLTFDIGTVGTGS